MDYRNSLSDPAEDRMNEEEIFNYDHLDNGIISSAIMSYSTRLGGRQANDEIQHRHNGIQLRDHLRLSF